MGHRRLDLNSRNAALSSQPMPFARFHRPVAARLSARLSHSAGFRLDETEGDSEACSWRTTSLRRKGEVLMAKMSDSGERDERIGTVAEGERAAGTSYLPVEGE